MVFIFSVLLLIAEGHLCVPKVATKSMPRREKHISFNKNTPKEVMVKSGDLFDDLIYEWLWLKTKNSRCFLLYLPYLLSMKLDQSDVPPKYVP